MLSWNGVSFSQLKTLKDELLTNCWDKRGSPRNSSSFHLWDKHIQRSEILRPLTEQMMPKHPESAKHCARLGLWASRIFTAVIQSNKGEGSGPQKQSRKVKAPRTEKLLNLAIRSAVPLEQFLSSGGSRSQDWWEGKQTWLDYKLLFLEVSQGERKGISPTLKNLCLNLVNTFV